MMGRGSSARILLWTLALTAPTLFGGTISSDEEILLRVTAECEEIELGKAFPLTVIRRFSKELEPDQWSDRQLTPLTVHLKETTRREDGRYIEETRHYVCYAFSLESITLPDFVFKARPAGGGPERVAVCDGITLRVLPALDPASPGPAELPGVLLSEPVPSRWLLFTCLGLLILAAASLLWFFSARARRAGMSHAVPRVAPYMRAMRRLDRLRGQQPATAPEIDAFYVEASALLRDYIGERFALRAPNMTTEEFLGAPQTAHVLQASHHDLLSRFLGCCDQVKFACHAPAATDRARILDEAERFLEATRNGDVAMKAEAASPEGSGAA